MPRNRHCAGCSKDLEWESEIGESGVYSPHRSYDLCIRCFDIEFALIGIHGNDLPEVLETYRRNVEANG